MIMCNVIERVHQSHHVLAGSSSLTSKLLWFWLQIRLWPQSAYVSFMITVINKNLFHIWNAPPQWTLQPLKSMNVLKSHEENKHINPQWCRCRSWTHICCLSTVFSAHLPIQCSSTFGYFYMPCCRVSCYTICISGRATLALTCFCLGGKKLSLPTGTSSCCHYRTRRWRRFEWATWAAWI